MEYSLAILLISVLTTNGLLALWAATSQTHWFLRTAVYLACLAPLLLVPAYEPFMALVLQGTLISLGVAMWRLVRRRPRLGLENGKPAESARAYRFSLASLLLTMVVCGVGAAVLANAPKLNREAWQSVAVIGVSGGIAVLLGRAAAKPHGLRGAAATVVALLVALAVSRAPVRMDWFVASLVKTSVGWPPDQVNFAGSYFLSPLPDLKTWIWYGVLPSVACLTMALVRLVTALTTAPSTAAFRHQAHRALAAAALLLGVIVALPAAGAYLTLIFPPAIPTSDFPAENAYDDFRDAAKSVGSVSVGSSRGTNFHNCDEYYLSESDLQEALQKVAVSIRLARQALKKPCLLPVDYRDALHESENVLQGWRPLARAFSAEGRLAELQGDFDGCLNAHLNVIELGYASRRGGFMLDLNAGAKLTAVGIYAVHRIRGQLTKAQCLDAIQRVEAAEALGEPFSAFRYRTYVRDLYAHGWHGRVRALVTRASEIGTIAAHEHSYKMEQANTGLFKGHLLLRAYRTEHKALPRSWEEVEPAGLPGLSVDPWDPHGRLLRYKVVGDDYLLYSVGPNGIDEGGEQLKGPTFFRLLRSGDFFINAFGRP